MPPRPRSHGDFARMQAERESWPPPSILVLLMRKNMPASDDFIRRSVTAMRDVANATRAPKCLRLRLSMITDDDAISYWRSD